MDIAVNWKILVSVWGFLCICVMFIRGEKGFMQPVISMGYGTFIFGGAILVVAAVFGILWAMGTWALWVLT